MSRARRLRKAERRPAQADEKTRRGASNALDRKRGEFFWATSCSLVAAVSFVRALWFGFVYDDHSQIVQNSQIQSWNHIGRLLVTEVWSQKGAEHIGYYYRPLFSVWLLLNHTIGGLAPWFWHLSSILLHALVTWAVFKLGLLLLQSLEAAAFAALLFALHPVHIESVCWVSASDELLYVTFFLTSIFIFARFRDGDRRKLGAPWLYVLLWGAALLTKETAVALLPVFPIMAFLENKGTQPLRNRALGAIRVCIPTFLTAAVYLVARFLVLRRFGTEIGQHTWRQVFFTGVDLLAFYIEKLIIPFHLSPFYANPVLSDLSLKICGTILLVAIAIPMACWITIRYEPLVGLATSLILLPIVPALVGVRIFRDGDLAHDRYLFLPSVGICLLFGLAFKYCWLRIPFPRQLTAVLGTILLLALGWLNFCQQSYYRDDDAFFKRGLEVGPTNSLVMAYLGDRYLGEGKKELGLAQLREASTISPDNPEALFHLARGLFETKHYAEAEPYLRRLSQDNRISWPRRSLLTLSLAQTELQLGKLSSAETTLQGLATTNDSLRGVHQSLGALYEIQGKLPEAQREYEREFQVSGDIRSRRRALVLERQGGRM